MVALSMADGYARLTNKPQCIIVHFDVGTQDLGQAVHNASAGRVPVLIFAGFSPYTTEANTVGLERNSCTGHKTFTTRILLLHTIAVTPRRSKPEEILSR